MMQYILTGFTQDKEFRVFTFEGVETGLPRTAVVVRVDLALIRKHGIRLQELPLLCRGLLEQRDLVDPNLTVIFTEEKMRVHVTDCAAARFAAAQKRKPRRSPLSGGVSEQPDGFPGGNEAVSAPDLPKEIYGSVN